MNQDEILESYYGKGAYRLHRAVDKILVKFGGISQKDADDFYSLANEVFVDVLRRYDGGQDFHVFLYFCLANRIKSEMTRRNREKRTIDREALSIDTPIGEGDDIIADLIPSGFDLEREVELRSGEQWSERAEKYLSGLSELQKRILTLKMEGMPKNRIIKELGLSASVYDRNLEQIRSIDRTKILLQGSAFGENRSKNTEPEYIDGGDIRDLRNREHNWDTGEIRDRKYSGDIEYSQERNDKEEIESMNETQTAEISKETVYPVSSIIRKTADGSIRDDHSLQRNAGQWSNRTRGDFIVSILHRYPVPAIIIAEQPGAEFTLNWLIDGKQRCTTCCTFAANAFKISRNVERPIVSYQAAQRDAHGGVCYEQRDFDVRGKSFLDLPKELKERFLDYTVPVVLYLNCSDDDIEYHIRRYNAAKPMSVSQKGITHLGERYAGCVKRIVEKPFFKDIGNYRVCEFVNGTMDRVVTESIMTVYFFQDWKKRNEDICAYLKLNADISHFEGFAEMVDRITKIITKDAAELFHSKDSFLWFGLYGRFWSMGEPDAVFIAFLREFKRSLHAKEVKHVSFDSLNAKPTKDKSTVKQKLDLLETLLEAFVEREEMETTA